MNVSDLVVNRWRRYGMDRLYVETPDGAKVGFWDLLTDEAHPEDPEHLAVLTAAVQGWRAANLTDAPVTTITAAASAPAGVVAAVPAIEPEPAPVAVLESVGRPWVDLASNRPGEQARDQALSARAEAPVKTVLARVLGVHTNERAWRIGADGEAKVATQLSKVAKKDPRWRFLHAIPVGNRGSDIDHLIIGPGGVFTANAKHHPGAKVWVGGDTLMVNGSRQPYVRNARHEAERASRLLTVACGFPVHVEGLIVTVNADDVVVKNQPKGVTVVPRMQVAKWLLRHGEVLTVEQVNAVFEVARRSTTWQP